MTEDKRKYNSKIPTRTWLPPQIIREMKGFEIQTSDIPSPPKRASNVDMASSSIRETKGFEIQTSDIRSPPKRASNVESFT